MASCTYVRRVDSPGLGFGLGRCSFGKQGPEACLRDGSGGPGSEWRLKLVTEATAWDGSGGPGSEWRLKLVTEATGW